MTLHNLGFTPRVGTRPNPISVLRAVVFIAISWWAFGQMHRVALHKGFTLDEFQWAHAAWAVSEGLVPYRDFFDVHFPFAYQFHSLVFELGGGDDPTAILSMRKLMVGVLLLMAAAMWRVNAGFAGMSKWWGLLAPVFCFTMLPWVRRATEVRHDPLAFTLVIGAVACLYMRRPRVEIRAVVGGLLLALACWTTQKVFIYGSVFFAALIADLIVQRRGAREFWLGHPLWFLLGSGVVVLMVAVDLTRSDVWAEFYQWCVQYPMRYQVKEPPVYWFSVFRRMLTVIWWQLMLSIVGVVATIRELRRPPADDEEGPRNDLILLGLWVTTWASWAFQQSAWSYSSIPFLGMSCIFAGRGAAFIFKWAVDLDARRGGSGLVVGISLFGTFALAMNRASVHLDNETMTEDRFDFSALAARYFDEEEQNLRGLPDAAVDQELEFERPYALLGESDPNAVAKPATEDDDGALPDDLPEPQRWERMLEEPPWAGLREPQNEYQLRVLSKIGELTSVDDAVYDNTGSYVTRPHAFSIYYTYAGVWNDGAEMLEQEIPAALERNEAAMVVLDKSRYKRIPAPVRKFISRNYVKYNADLMLPGMAFTGKSSADSFVRVRKKFRAMKGGTYFVHPEDFFERHQLQIDGETIRGPYFEVEAGEHDVRYQGPGLKFWLLWLPRNGEVWHPNTEGKRHFCCRSTG